MNYLKWLTMGALTLVAGMVCAQSLSGSGLDAGSATLAQRGGGAIVLTQNTDPVTIVSANSVSCNASGLHADNSYMRRFDLDGEFGLSAPFVVESVDVGVESATGAGGSQPVSVVAYSIANADPLVFANLTEVGRIDTTVADTSLTIESFVFTSSAVDPTTDDLVIEVFTPDGQTDGNSFFIGSNDLGQSAPSYISAPACGLDEPTDAASIGFADMHIVMTVFGSAGGNPPPDTSNPVPAMSGLSLWILVLVVAGLGVIALRRMA